MALIKEKSMKRLISIVLAFALIAAPNINGYAQIWKNRTISPAGNDGITSGSMTKKDKELSEEENDLQKAIRDGSLTYAEIEKKQNSIKNHREKLEKRVKNLNKDFEERVKNYVKQGMAKEAAKKRAVEDMNLKYSYIPDAAIVLAFISFFSFLGDNAFAYILSGVSFVATLVLVFIPMKADAATIYQRSEEDKYFDAKADEVLENPFAFADISIEDLQVLFEKYPYSQTLFNNTYEVYENLDKYGVYPARENPACAEALEKMKFKDIEDFLKNMPQACKSDPAEEMAYAAQWYRDNAPALDAQLKKMSEAAANSHKAIIKTGVNKQVELMRQRGIIHSAFE